jgi:hypothetical protein
MGCHIYDPTFKALGLTYPISLRSEGKPPNKDNWGFDAKIHYIFPKTKYSQGKNLPVTWYDGGQRPPESITSLLEGKKLPGQGSVIIGTKGVMLIPHVGMPELFPKKDFADLEIKKWKVKAIGINSSMPCEERDPTHQQIFLTQGLSLRQSYLEESQQGFPKRSWFGMPRPWPSRETRKQPNW